MDIDEWQQEADTFNANCVLIPYKVFVKVGPIDSHYIHSLGDFDYGLELKRHGNILHVSKDYCGICDINSIENTWVDVSLDIKERVRRKEAIKGAPTKQWFYFLKKNFGIGNAIFGSLTPFVRILLRL